MSVVLYDKNGRFLRYATLIQRWHRDWPPTILYDGAKTFHLFDTVAGRGLYRAAD